MPTNYFRADAQMIAKLIDKDCLRFTAENLATLICVFSVSTRSAGEVPLTVLLKGDLAERISCEDNINGWFEVKGELRNSAIPYNDYTLPGISISALSVSPLPNASKSQIYCEVIGRLTSDAEAISKTNNFNFTRFSLAVNRSQSDKAHFFDFSVFKPALMEAVDNETTKGKSIFAAGELTFYKQGGKSSPGYSIKLEKLITLG